MTLPVLLCKCFAIINLALGIGIQNFPEGLAVSLPLQAAGFSVWRAFCVQRSDISISVSEERWRGGGGGSGRLDVENARVRR
ncbi:Zinc transporter ZIP11 [Papilio xuthus]|uniref:Zinc transporter ZIP11 n=1 Tax=Papilio xuthus TaxID=66420 RepID=A0A194PWD8_PAPXU|nr:Zinc transporter ZIP11 [Papilio xuthus]